MINGILSPAAIMPTDALGTGRVQGVKKMIHQEDIRRAALEYESYFLSYLMKAMRTTVPKASLTENPMGESFYSFYDEEIGKRAAQSGGFGLADFILSSLAQEPSELPGHYPCLSLQ